MNEKQREEAIKDIDRVLNINYGVNGSLWAIEAYTARKACIIRWAPKGSVYEKDANKVIPNSVEAYAKKGMGYNQATEVEGILKTLRRDIDAKVSDISFEGSIKTALFDDMFCQANELFQSGYYIPAVVMAGGVLEQFLKELSKKLEIPIMSTTNKGEIKPIKISTINDNLRNANAYSQAQWRLIQAWLDIRNLAAHNDEGFKEITKTQINQMLDGILELLIQ